MKLKQSIANTRTRVHIMSRDEVEIRSELCPDVAKPTGPTLYECPISKRDIESDITLFSRDVVDTKLPNKDEELRNDLATQMAEKCDGMFLWIRMQQDKLRRSKTRKQQQKVIDDMPAGLEHTYDRNWIQIMHLSTLEWSRALAILRWATFA